MKDLSSYFVRNLLFNFTKNDPHELRKDQQPYRMASCY